MPWNGRNDLNQIVEQRKSRVTEMQLKGRSAIVTGAARGIGKGIAECLLREGAKVAIADINGSAAAATAKEYADIGETIAITADVTKSDQVRRMMDEAADAFDYVDIAVNNAGIVSVKPLEDISEVDFDRVMEVNVKSVFLCCQIQAPMMVQGGGGAIINIASTAGKIGFQSLSHYCASKFAVVGFTNSIAKEYARLNVRINAICPGLVGTDMWMGEHGLANVLKEDGETIEESWQRNVRELLPQGVPQTPEDMGRLAVFLSVAPHIIGQSINVCGGYAAH